MRSGKKFSKVGRPSLLEQKLGPRPAYLQASNSDVSEALAQSLASSISAHKEWLADVQIEAFGIGTTSGRRNGAKATHLRAKAFQDYIRRNYSHLFLLGNNSEIERRIYRAEAQKGDSAWSDEIWCNGADGHSPHNPKPGSLRKLLPKIISGKG